MFLQVPSDSHPRGLGSGTDTTAASGHRCRKAEDPAYHQGGMSVWPVCLSSSFDVPRLAVVLVPGPGKAGQCVKSVVA